MPVAPLGVLGSAPGKPTLVGCQVKADLFARFNAGAWAAYPAAKSSQLTMLESSATNYYRVTSVIFDAEIEAERPTWNRDLIAMDHSLGEGPTFGDPHLGNLAGFDTDIGVLPVIDDFDDSGVGPRLFDLVRAFVSLLVNFPTADREAVAHAFARGYARGLVGDDARKDLAELFKDATLKPTSSKLPPGDVAVSDAVRAAALRAFDAYETAANIPATVCTKEVSFLVIRGGSSLGLPRFRLRCASFLLELKAARASAYAFSLGATSATHDDERIAINATRLTAFMPTFGKFMAAGRVFSGDSPFAPFEFYVYRRQYRTLPSNAIDAKDAPDLAGILGKAIGLGHGHSGARLLSDAEMDSLTNGLRLEAHAWYDTVMSDAATVPACLR